MSDRIGLCGHTDRAFARRESHDPDLPGIGVRRVVRRGPAQPTQVGPNGPAGGSGRAEGALQADVGERELGLVGTARGDGEVDAARAGAHLGAEPEQLEAYGLRRSIGELGVAQIAGFVVGLLIAAGIALWHLHVRRTASSIAAIIAIPICLTVVARVSLFDPWFWYALANRTRFEALAASDSPSKGPKYTVVVGRDVSTGLAGLSPNHLVLIIYDESDAVGLDPSERPAIWRTRSMNPEGSYIPIPRGTQLFGHFFRVDEFR